MTTAATLELTEQLIAIPSVSGAEQAVCEAVENILRNDGWNVSRIPITSSRWCVFAHAGVPTVVFSTHLDVVPAPSSLFSPRFDGERLFGRGACDAKGVAACMIAAARVLRTQGRNNFGLLFVVGEEVDGAGAIAAREALQNAGISWIINGEPTEGKVMRGHKGHLGAEIRCSGRACHSGYPHLGEDANAKLIRIADRLLKTSWGTDPDLGVGTINLGVLSGGQAWNVVSPEATLRCIVRTVGQSNELALESLRKAVADEGLLQILADANPVTLETFAEFPTEVAAFGTDIPHFGSLADHYVLFGPGTIHVAHTDRESISRDEVATGIQGYVTLFNLISNRIAPENEIRRSASWNQ